MRISLKSCCAFREAFKDMRGVSYDRSRRADQFGKKMDGISPTGALKKAN
jgi:hypothetical protein